MEGKREKREDREREMRGEKSRGEREEMATIRTCSGDTVSNAQKLTTKASVAWVVLPSVRLAHKSAAHRASIMTLPDPTVTPRTYL